MLTFAPICSLNRFIRALDADGNGYVDFLEFIMVNNLFLHFSILFFLYFLGKQPGLRKDSEGKAQLGF